jgi:hypothetical protein
VELNHELDAGGALVLHERGRTTAAEQELATTQSALGVEQAALGAERVARAFAEGQAQSRGQRITELEVTVSQKKGGLKIIEATMIGEWFFPPIPSVLFHVLWPLTFALFMLKARNEE